MNDLLATSDQLAGHQPLLQGCSSDCAGSSGRRRQSLGGDRWSSWGVCGSLAVARALLGCAVFTAILMQLSGDAAASCGDYVVIGGRHAAMSATSPSLPMATHQELPRRDSCSGPHCGQQKLPTIPPVTQQLSHSVELAAIYAASGGADSKRSRWLWLSVCAQHAAGYPAGIERPPQQIDVLVDHSA